MVSVFVIILVAVVAGFISFYERYQKKMFIAKVIDGQNITSNFISQECQLVIAQLNDRANLKQTRYNSMLILPDGQELCYRFDDFAKMKDHSKLRFQPTDTEWEILRGLVKKVLS